MLPYIPGLGNAAAGTDEDADILEQTEPVSSPFRAHRQALLPLRFEQMSPRSAQRCTERALQSQTSPMAGSPQESPGSYRSNVAFGSPVSASPTKAIEAERQWWAEASERQLENLSQVVKAETARCFEAMDHLKAQMKEEIRQETASLTDQFGAMLNSMEQRLRREQQANHQAAMEAARRELFEELESKNDTMMTSALVSSVRQAESIPISPSAKWRRDQAIEEMGLRVDGLAVKLEEQLTVALAEERRTRSKALSDICEYIEHMVGQESEAKDDTTRVQDSVSRLAGRIQVVEEAMALYLAESQQLPETAITYLRTRVTRAQEPPDSTDEPLILLTSDPDPGDLSYVFRNGRHADEPMSPRNLSVFQDGAATGESVDRPAYTQPQGNVSSAEVPLSLLSEDMRESWNNIVRNMGNTVPKDQDTRQATDPPVGRGPDPTSAPRPVIVPAAPASAPNLQPLMATVVGTTYPPLQSSGVSGPGPSQTLSAQPQLRVPAYWTQRQ